MLTAILESRKGNGSEYVFEGRYAGHLQEPRAPLEKLRRQMGWHWLLHDLRRTCISAGEKAGVPFLALKAIAGHSVVRSVTERYVMLDSEFVRGHLETINARLLQLMETSVEQWKSNDETARWGIFDQEAMKSGDQKAHMAISFIEKGTDMALIPPAAEWEDEVYF